MSVHMVLVCLSFTQTEKDGLLIMVLYISYYVTAQVEAGDYKCDCCKMSKDGMLCCHILKKITHIGVDAIPTQYILRRWTQQAILCVAPSIEAEPDEMPPQSKKLVRQANLSMDFASLARVASGSDAGAAILRKHMRAARTELNHFNKTKKKKQKVTALPMAGPAPPQSRGTAHPGHIVATTTGPMAANSAAQQHQAQGGLRQLQGS